MTPVVSAFAPGRLELLGNHTDYNEGLVLGAAIDRGLTVSGIPRDDDVIKISSTLMGQVEIALSDLRPQKQAAWANYALGVVRQLIDRGIDVRGFEAKVEGNLPARSGLSSSAAFEVATALFLLKLHGRELPAMDLARLCQRAEHKFVGVQSGLLDQVMSIFGQADRLIFFDTRTEEVRLIPFPNQLALIIVDSGKQRELSRGDYNLRRNQTLAAARALKVRALRDVSPTELHNRTDLDPLLKRRALHVVGENERVERALQFLASGNIRGFGELLNESHESSRQNFENSTPELDLLVELTRDIPGILGARLTGAGFGGAIVAMCQRAEAEAAVRHLQDSYRKRIGITAGAFVCQVSDGAR